MDPIGETPKKNNTEHLIGKHDIFVCGYVFFNENRTKKNMFVTRHSL